jgi:hypothetical protein
MAGTLTISTLSDGTNSTSSTNCIKGSAKAWASFSVSGTTVTVTKNYNISLITRSAAGAYTFTFTTALSDANYSAVGNSSISTGSQTVIPSMYGQSGSPYYSVPTTSSFTFYYYNSASSGVDPTYGSVVVFD